MSDGSLGSFATLKVAANCEISVVWIARHIGPYILSGCGTPYLLNDYISLSRFNSDIVSYACTPCVCIVYVFFQTAARSVESANIFTHIILTHTPTHTHMICMRRYIFIYTVAYMHILYECITIFIYTLTHSHTHTHIVWARHYIFVWSNIIQLLLSSHADSVSLLYTIQYT